MHNLPAVAVFDGRQDLPEFAPRLRLAQPPVVRKVICGNKHRFQRVSPKESLRTPLTRQTQSSLWNANKEFLIVILLILPMSLFSDWHLAAGWAGVWTTTKVSKRQTTQASFFSLTSKERQASTLDLFLSLTIWNKRVWGKQERGGKADHLLVSPTAARGKRAAAEPQWKSTTCRCLGPNNAGLPSSWKRQTIPQGLLLRTQWPEKRPTNIY